MVSLSWVNPKVIADTTCSMLSVTEDRGSKNPYASTLYSNIQTLAWEQMTDIRTHMHLASNTFNTVLLRVSTNDAKFLNDVLPRIMTRSNTVMLNMDSSILVRDVVPAINNFAKPEDLRYCMAKNKTVGELNG